MLVERKTVEHQLPLERTEAKLHIALLGYRSNPFSGGQGVYLKNVAAGLAALGHQVDVISGEPYPDLTLDPQIKLIKLPGLNLYAATNKFRALTKKNIFSTTDLFEWLSVNTGGFPEPYTFGCRVFKYLQTRRDKYDIIHDNQTLSPGILKLQKLGIPVVTTIHHPITFDRDIALAHNSSRGMRLLIRRWHNFLNMQTRVAASLQHIITVSENSKQDISKAFDVASHSISVIPNGIDTTLYQPQPHISRAPNYLITTASADQPLKGTQHLIPAFAELHEQLPDLRLIFIGKPKPDGTTHQLIRKFELQDHIEFVHGISNAEVVQLYAKATIAVVPSEYEGFGLPAAEAMACGVPVVATNGGALAEVVGTAGVVVDKANPHALAVAISELLADTARQRKLAQAGRARVEQYFSAPHAAQVLQAYYQGLLAI